MNDVFQTTNPLAPELTQTEVQTIQSTDALTAIVSAEIDKQISTAKAYPRDIMRAISRIRTLATMDQDTASECFYVLRRGGHGSGAAIEGISIRMAEIVASQWGNMRVQARIIANNGKTITAQGVCHDLESNYAASVEVSRRITDKSGRTYNDDMQAVTAQAACAIAFRNAVNKVVPKSILKRIYEEVKKVSVGQALDLESSRQNVVLYFQKIGVTEEQLFDYLGIHKREEIDSEMVAELRSIAAAIKDGHTTAQELFVTPHEEKKATDEAKAKAQQAASKAAAVAAAALKTTAPQSAPQPEPAKANDKPQQPEKKDYNPFIAQ